MAKAHYPDPRRLDLTEEIFGHPVHDPYRWLEDPDSEETRSWLAAQDALFGRYAAELPGRDEVAARVAELMRAGSVGPPVWRGERRFFLRRTPDQDHAVLFTATGEQGTDERVLIDPMAIDPSGITTLDAWQPDKEGELLAYQLSEGGNEESILRVLDVATGEVVDGPIDRLRYSVVGWLPGTSPSRGPYGKAFYYVRRLPPGDVPADERQYHRRVYLHRVGTPASDDITIFGDGLEKTNYYRATVSRDGRDLVVVAAQGTAPRNELWLADLTESAETAPAFRPVQRGVDARSHLMTGRDGTLYVFTDAGAPRGRLAVADRADPAAADRWRDLIGERPDAVLTDFSVLDGDELDRPVLLAAWKQHSISEITVHDLATGAQTGRVPLPGFGSIGGISDRPGGGHEAWFSYTDNTTPPVIQHYDARTGEVQVWARAPGSVEVPRVRTEQVTYQSKDGTEVRMLIISGDEPGPGGGAPRPARPTILYGYGGFGVSMNPAYSATTLAWVEAGGVYVITSLRGGSEEGEEWHRAGMRERKERVFEDFEAAAGYLIANGWTTRGQLAIYGGSNGGLLVGAAVTKWPGLYAAAICSAPLLDMVRYERFGLGETWNDEFGTAADPEELEWLLGYSPYHHVKDGTAYPAVLFSVFESDTRVDPLHARKMCAAMQHATTSPLATPREAAALALDGPPGPVSRPILLRRETSAGHGARAVSRSVSVAADILAFAGFHTGHPGFRRRPDQALISSDR
ncbi:MAG TPA: prolyl oligopeptidase family serine peptidase [Streptosporangiaceae bacterium]|jgi:prolyl oligopeptidase|nr:prolyl oligopeptidase family serine peptidase [Streptosporangiaceae bacterium]